MHNQRNTIIIGVSSSIAAYKIVSLVKLLRKKKIEVSIIMTQKATKIINCKEFEKITGHKVFTDLFQKGFDYKEILVSKEVEHIKLAKLADLMVIAPATANVIGKIANGIADDYLTTVALATTAPILVCPAMNTNMWHNPAVVRNIHTLESRGYIILPPESGHLACGSDGAGRLADIKVIYKKVVEVVACKDRLKGKKIIVTAGGTIEPIDAVRVITNRSSGKMGVALAEECYMQGAEVLLLESVTAASSNMHQDTSGVAGMQGFPRGGGIRTEVFETAKNLKNLIKEYVKDYNVIFHAAAVSDFVSEKRVEGKIDSSLPFNLRLHPAPKILDQIKSWNPKILLIGFKAVYKLSDNDLVSAGMKKLRESSSDYIVVNDVGRAGIGFGTRDNEVYIINPRGLLNKITKAPKSEVARKILECVFQDV